MAAARTVVNVLCLQEDMRKCVYIIGEAGLIIRRCRLKRSLDVSSGSSQCLRPVPPGIELDRSGRQAVVGSNERGVATSNAAIQLEKRRSLSLDSLYALQGQADAYLHKHKRPSKLQRAGMMYFLFILVQMSRTVGLDSRRSCLTSTKSAIKPARGCAACMWRSE